MSVKGLHERLRAQHNRNKKPGTVIEKPARKKEEVGAVTEPEETVQSEEDLGVEELDLMEDNEVETEEEQEDYEEQEAQQEEEEEEPEPEPEPEDSDDGPQDDEPEEVAVVVKKKKKKKKANNG